MNWLSLIITIVKVIFWVLKQLWKEKKKEKKIQKMDETKKYLRDLHNRL